MKIQHQIPQRPQGAALVGTPRGGHGHPSPVAIVEALKVVFYVVEHASPVSPPTTMSTLEVNHDQPVAQ